MITADNWNYCTFSNLKLKAGVTLGAEPTENGDTQFLYFVTVTDHDDNDVFQSTHFDLLEAVDVLNQRYGHWDFNDPLKNSPSSDSGCGSCSAH